MQIVVFHLHSKNTPCKLGSISEHYHSYLKDSKKTIPDVLFWTGGFVPTWPLSEDHNGSWNYSTVKTCVIKAVLHRRSYLGGWACCVHPWGCSKMLCVETHVLPKAVGSTSTLTSLWSQSPFIRPYVVSFTPSRDVIKISLVQSTGTSTNRLSINAHFLL